MQPHITLARSRKGYVDTWEATVHIPDRTQANAFQHELVAHAPTMLEAYHAGLRLVAILIGSGARSHLTVVPGAPALA